MAHQQNPMPDHRELTKQNTISQWNLNYIWYYKRHLVYAMGSKLKLDENFLIPAGPEI